MKNAYDYLKCMLKDNDVIIVGCSGGPDSMALMYLLQEIRKTRSISIICAHVNHNIRVKESAAEAVFLKNYCMERNIIFEYMKIEQYSDDNFHNQARKIRYEFFEQIVNKYSAKYLMTAHHGDDLMETILMRIVRGSTLKGYAGFEQQIKKSGYTIIRPLIYATKMEIEQFNKDNNIPYVTDLSNFKDKYTRNRYRKNALPFLKQEDPLVHEKFIKYSNTLLEYNAYINKILDRVIKKVYIDDEIDISLFLQEELLIQKKLIFFIFEQIYNDDLNEINTSHVTALINLIKSNKTSGVINLPGDYIALKEYSKLRIIRDKKEISNYEIELSEYVELPNHHIIKKINEDPKNDNNILRINSEEIELPLYVRNRCKGDRMFLKKINGSRKIKDIFIDSKVPIMQRDSWPVVVDSQDTILWLPGLKKSKFSKQKTEKYDIILKYTDKEEFYE